jgi:hypothetical protein
MKLISISIFPSGESGWRSDLLTFGENITHLFGPNGCGKTPIMQSISYCLGYPSVFRNDIYENCAYVELKIETEKGYLTIKREYSREVDIEVAEPGGSKQRFFDENEYSRYLFEWLGVQTPNLIEPVLNFVCRGHIMLTQGAMNDRSNEEAAQAQTPRPVFQRAA